MNDPANLPRTPTLAALALLGLSSFLSAQQLTLTPSLAVAGQRIQAVLRNNTQSPLFYIKDCEVRTLRHSGEFYDVSIGYPSPRTVLPTEACDQVVTLPPGASANIFFNAPNEPGTYTVITADLQRAAARLVVATPAPAAQDVCFYPTGVWLPQTAHEVDFQRPSNTTWEFANTGGTPHVFGRNDRIRLYVPGGVVPAGILDLAGIRVPAGQVTEVTLPLHDLTVGPHAVEASFVDATAGAVVTRSGIQPRGARVDLHMHDGHDLAAGGQLGMAIGVTGFATTRPGPFYFVLMGYQPGSTPLPGGLQAPLSLADPLVRASISSGLGGLLLNNIGRVTNSNPAGVPFFAGGVENLFMRGPNLPGLSGFVLRVAVLAADARMTTWGASQPEEIVLR